MKTFIWIVLIILVLGGGYLYFVSERQDAEIESIPQAEVSGESETSDPNISEGSKTVILTKTSSGITQENPDENPFVVDKENTYLRFTGYKVGGEHVGSFETMRAEINVIEGAVLGGKVTIDATSVKTDTDKVDEHLQTADFFDTAKYPEIIFVSKEVMYDDMNQSAIMKGSLTLHGVTKEISAPITILSNGIATDFTISLKEFGIEFPVVKDEVRIESQIIVENL